MMMARTNDRGGGPTDEPLNTAEHPLADWEALSDALHMVLARKGLSSADRLRRAIEDMPSDEYLALSYYERWARATETLLREADVLSHEELNRKIAALEEP